MTDPAPPSSLDGEVLDGRYHVGESIGRGGHGVVYRAHDDGTGRDVAIKFLHPEFANDPEFNVRLLREAQVASKLTGTAAIEMYALRSDKSGALYIVMELLEGHDLSDYLATFESVGKKLPLLDVVRVFDPIVRTLEQAHGMGIVHRDLKPGNIYVCNSGAIKLLDWGLVKVMKATALTKAGMVAGSPTYIAPEVWRGDPSKLDQRIDNYSLGALIYRVLAGQPPFSGHLLELMQASMTAKRPSLYALRPDLPPAVDDWVEQALAVSREQRFARVRGMWAALRGILGV